MIFMIDNIQYYNHIKNNDITSLVKLFRENLSGVEGVYVGDKAIGMIDDEVKSLLLAENQFSTPILYFNSSVKQKFSIVDDNLNVITCFRSPKDNALKLVFNLGLKDIGQRESTILRIMNQRIISHERNMPENIVKNDIQKRKNKIRRSIENRYAEMPELHGEFISDLETICEHARNREEFKEFIAMSDSVFNLSDRNLTRISRATICFEGESLSLGKEHNEELIRIYRAMPSGSLIEEGDWVTTSQDYAENHVRLTGDQDCIVDYIDVSPNDVYSVNDENEAIYAPLSAWKGATSLDEVWALFANPHKPLSFPEVKARTLDEIESQPSR